MKLTYGDIDRGCTAVPSIYRWRLPIRYGLAHDYSEIDHEHLSLAGSIFGTGTNGAFVEDIHKIKKLANSSELAGFDQMVVNCEWGAFNNTVSQLGNVILLD